MDGEVEGKGKPLTYKVKAMSRETAAQKAINLLDADLRNYWSTATNTKEWVLLELQEPCLLSHIRIHNKSVLEWEIAAGLRYKPETFVKVRSRCEAPRRDVIYHMNYTPCRYVRLSCLRGSPIAIYFIELIGISVPGLEPEFQPVVNHLLPQIVAHEQDSNSLHLQLLQDITDQLHMFIPQIETELVNYTDDLETSTRFLAMLAGPFNPILQIVTERETARSTSSGTDSELSRSSQSAPPLTVSSNFEPRKQRSTSAYPFPTSRSTVFRPDAIFKLLRRAFVKQDLGIVCKVAAKILHSLTGTSLQQEESTFSTKGMPSLLGEAQRLTLLHHAALSNYSELFGDDFQIPNFNWDPSYTDILDIGALEEGIFHVLYACAAEPVLCSKLAGNAEDFWLALPLIQALLPALRPVSCSVSVDDTFSQWGQPFVQQSLSKIVSALSSSVYHPLLHGCAGYLSSFSPSHVKTACVLIDLCSSALGPWMTRIIAKIDLAVELLEDVLGVIQGERLSLIRVRAALEYLVLALSGYMDDVLGEYKEAKLRVLFLLEMLENFLVPAFVAAQNIDGYTEFSCTSFDSPETICAIALQVIRTAVRKASVLPYLELEWRLGSVPPSVLLSILDPHLQLPPEIDNYSSSTSKVEKDTSSCFPLPSASCEEGSLKSSGQVDGDGSTDVNGKVYIFEDVSLLFAPKELKNLTLVSGTLENRLQSAYSDLCHEERPVPGNDICAKLVKDAVSASESPIKYFSLNLDCSQLLDYEVCKARSSEFRRLALDLSSQQNITFEGHNAAVDALILSAECYIDPFMFSGKEYPMVTDHVRLGGNNCPQNQEVLDLKQALGKINCKIEDLSHLEQKRDRVFIEILIEAAEMDRNYYQNLSDDDHCPYGSGAEELGNLFGNHTAFLDAITLLRRNQALLCSFIIHQLRREQKSLHGPLMQCLVFLLHSATKLVCSPEEVIDIILESAENFNLLLTSVFHQSKEGNLLLSPRKVYHIQRHWMILQSLVIASSGGGRRLKNVSGLQYNTLIPPSTWVGKIPTFTSCSLPLVRYLGWMAISRIAKGYLSERLFLTSTLSQLSHLLYIFTEELALTSFDQDTMKEGLVPESVRGTQFTKVVDKLPIQSHDDFSFTMKYPDLSIFFPDMSKEVKAFGECILEAVALQLRSVASTAIPDILCWLSDLCLSPFSENTYKDHNSHPPVKGFLAKNAKAIIFYVLEAIVSEHMEAVVPELPRLVQVLGSLCKSSYSDVPFLSSIMRMLKPIISYSLHKTSNMEKHLVGESCLDFESLCFSQLFVYLKLEREKVGYLTQGPNIALVIFILASVFCDLSFDRKREIIQLSVRWVDFSDFEPTSMFHDYICAFQQLLIACNDFSVQNLRLLCFVPMPECTNLNIHSPENEGSRSLVWFPDNFFYGHRTVENENREQDNSACSTASHVGHLSSEELDGFSEDLKTLFGKLVVRIESSWSLHPGICRSLVVLSAQCLVYSRFLSSVIRATSDLVVSEATSKSSDEFFTHWNVGMEVLAENIMVVLEKGCFEVASTMIDCLLRVPPFCRLDNVVSMLSAGIEKIMQSAPKISWRLRTNNWLSNLFSRGTLMCECGIFLLELLSKMLSHPEPEQRFTALMHLGRLLGLDVNGGWSVLTCPSCDKIASLGSIVSISETVLSQLVSKTWDLVAFMAYADVSLHLRTLAKALLVYYIPFAEHARLRSLLESADSFLPSLGDFAYPMAEGLSAQLSLAVIAGVFLYCSAEDLSLVPLNVWRYIEILGHSKMGTYGDMERRICQALWKVKNDEDDAKAALKDAVSSCSAKEFDPEFGGTRESVLQVLANLTSVQSYLDLFAEQMDQEASELVEAELEMGMLQNEVTLQDDDRDASDLVFPSNTMKDSRRLQQIKDDIRSLEKSQLKEEIIARRQKKLSLRHERQNYLEEASVREAELQRELDRQRTLEFEKEIERQRLLELERAKTNELRYNLDVEKERQTQREIQRELEQIESGGRQPRREFLTSTQSSRPRDRYRDRDNGRSSVDGSVRVSSTSLTPDIPVNNQPVSTQHAVVLSGSRSFSGQLPTILQARDGGDDCISNYDENFDLSKDSGDTSSTGDPELASGFDGLPIAFGSSQRHASRGSKSRQILDRRERDGRREGKWERKQ